LETATTVNELVVGQIIHLKDEHQSPHFGRAFFVKNLFAGQKLYVLGALTCFLRCGFFLSRLERAEGEMALYDSTELGFLTSSSNIQLGSDTLIGKKKVKYLEDLER